jgi:hypothetical protein
VILQAGEITDIALPLGFVDGVDNDGGWGCCTVSRPLTMLRDLFTP